MARFVPGCFASKARISRRSRSTCRGPLFGGTYRSTSDENASNPTRSLLLTAHRARQCRQFRRGGPLRELPRAKALTCGHIHGENHRQFTFFDKPLDERMPDARRHVPVDECIVVAGLVLAHLFERQPGPLNAEWYSPPRSVCTSRRARRCKRRTCRSTSAGSITEALAVVG